MSSLQVFTLGGSFSGIQSMDKGGETFSFPAGPWSQTTSILGEVINSDDPQGMFRTDNYGFFFAWTGNSGAHLIPPLLPPPPLLSPPYILQ